MKGIFVAFVLATLATVTGCSDEEITNLAGLSEETYKPSRANELPMTFPGRDQTVYKAYGKFKDKPLPKPYSHPKSWVVYMAAPGWTNGGESIVDRLSTDAVAVGLVKEFIFANNLHDQVKVAWLQYDRSPGAPYVESLKTVPDNFIPLFLKPHGPEVNLYVYSPAVRKGPSQVSMRYDEWLKPYLPFAKKVGNDYVATNDFQKIQGFNNLEGEYWDSWARHWFIVNPEGIVVDAYFSNLGNYYIQGADKPINSLIHHLKLDHNTLRIRKIITARYSSYYTPPYWEQLDSEFSEALHNAVIKRFQ